MADDIQIICPKTNRRILNPLEVSLMKIKFPKLKEQQDISISNIGVRCTCAYFIDDGGRNYCTITKQDRVMYD
jgi:hypothetical protein